MDAVLISTSVFTTKPPALDPGALWYLLCMKNALKSLWSVFVFLYRAIQVLLTLLAFGAIVALLVVAFVLSQMHIS